MKAICDLLCGIKLYKLNLERLISLIDVWNCFQLSVSVCACSRAFECESESECLKYKAFYLDLKNILLGTGSRNMNHLLLQIPFLCNRKVT